MLTALIDLGSQAMRHQMRAATRRLVLLGLAAVCALFATAFLLLAAFILVADALGAVPAACAFAVGFLCLALLFAIMARKRQQERPEADMLAALKSASELAATSTVTAPGPSLAAAFVGGLILALRLRK